MVHVSRLSPGAVYCQGYSNLYRNGDSNVARTKFLISLGARRSHKVAIIKMYLCERSFSEVSEKLMTLL